VAGVEIQKSISIEWQGELIQYDPNEKSK
jgi:hypothetical protein